MFVLGLIVILFIILHLYQFWYHMMFAELAGVEGSINPQDGAQFINYYFKGDIIVTVLYLIWFAALWFHLTHGIYIFAINLDGNGAFFVGDSQFAFRRIDAADERIARNELGVHHICTKAFAHQPEGNISYIFHRC